MKYIIQVDGVYLGTENGLMLTWVNYKQQATEFSKEDMLTHIATIADSSHNIEHYTNIRNECNYVINNIHNENNITQNNINVIFVTTEPCSVLVLDR